MCIDREEDRNCEEKRGGVIYKRLYINYNPVLGNNKIHYI